MASKKVAPKPPPPQIHQLRALNNLITTTPPAQLPAALSTLSTTLPPLAPLLSASHAPNSEISTLIHQLKTRTTTLLSDRSPYGKLAGIILISALLSSTGATFLATTGEKWVKGLISIISTPNSVGTEIRKLAIRVSTELLVLAKEEEGLAREIATPNVPLLVGAGIGLVEGKGVPTVKRDAIAGAVLKCLSVLIPRHNATMRPFIKRIVAFVNRIVNVGGEEEATAEDKIIVGEHTKELARKVYVLLHDCSTKAGSLPDRNTGFSKLLEGLELKLEECFTVFFDAGSLEFQARPLSSTKIPSFEDVNSNLQWMKAYITTPSSKTVNIAVERITQVIGLIATASLTTASAHLSEIPKQDRERYLLYLPHLQVTALQLAEAILDRYGSIVLPVSTTILNAAVNTFTNNKTNATVRTAVYSLLVPLLAQIGPSLPTTQGKLLIPTAQSLCADILPAPVASTTPSSTAALTQTSTISTKAPSAESSTTNPRMPVSPAAQAAHRLLPQLLAMAPASLPPSARALLDRTAVLAQHGKALAASALNPQAGRGASVAPLAMRCGDAWAGMEGVVRPRLPGAVAVEGVLSVEAEENGADEVMLEDEAQDFEEEAEEEIDETDVPMRDSPPKSDAKHQLNSDSEDEIMETGIKSPPKRVRVLPPPSLPVIPSVAMQLDQSKQEEEESSDDDIDAALASLE